MAIIGIIAPSFNFGPGQLIGQNFASTSFAETLARRPDVDEVHLFVSNGAHREAASQYVKAAWPDLSSKIRLVFDFELPERLRKTAYEAILCPSISVRWTDLAFLRREIGANFRLLAVMATISYPSLEGELLQFMNAPLTPNDVVLCCSVAARDAFHRIIAMTRAKFDVRAPLNFSTAVVPYAVDTERFRPGERSALKARLGLGSEGIFLSLARLSVIDKFDAGPLLEAFALAKPHFDRPWRLVLAGGAPDASYAELLKVSIRVRGLEDAVQIWPNVEEADKPALLSSADVFVSPGDNVQESYGLSVVEALASGTPALVSDWNGYRDTVSHGEAGIRVPTYMPSSGPWFTTRHLHHLPLMHLVPAQTTAIDVDQLAASFILLANDDGLRTSLGHNARAVACTKFSHKAVATLLATLLAHPQPAPTLPDAGAFDTPWSLFADYPTRALLPGDRLEAVYGGPALETASALAYRAPDLEPFIAFEKLDFVADYFRSARSVAEFERVIEGDPRLDFALYYALKQGLLRFVGEA